MTLLEINSIERIELYYSPLDLFVKLEIVRNRENKNALCPSPFSEFIASENQIFLRTSFIRIEPLDDRTIWSSLGRFVNAEVHETDSDIETINEKYNALLRMGYKVEKVIKRK